MKIDDIDKFLEDLNSSLKERKNNRHFGQNGEAGVLEKLLLDYLKVKPTFCLEFGSGMVGYKNGTANIRYLYDNYECKCVYFDVDKSRKLRSDSKYRDQVHIETITSTNVNDIFKKYKVPKNLDVLVIDVDGQDYWIWKNLEYEPKVLMIEFNPSINSEELKVMHKDDDHHTWRNNRCSYYGASIKSMKKLGLEKGYSLVFAVDRNLFFVRKELIDVDINENILHSELEDDFDRKYIEEQKWIEI